VNWLVPLPVALPLLVAAALVAVAPMCRRRLADSIAILTALAVTATCGWLLRLSAENTIVYWFGDWLPRGALAMGISFAIDPIGAAMAGFCSCLVTVALIYAWEYFEAVRTYFHALMLIFLAAMTGFCLTGDLFNLFVFFELMSVVAYALTGYKVEEKQALAGAMNFAVTNSIGGFSVLIGVALLYGRTEALNMAQVGETLAQHPGDAVMIVALTVILCGFFIKAAVAPFHFWLADAHAVAPTPVCVLFSGVMIELGLYGAFRVYWTIFRAAPGLDEHGLRLVFMVLGAFTAVLGAVMCFAQRHLKRLLAFSSISHIGMMLLGLACLTPKGIAGAALYVLGHGCIKGALFLCAGLLLHRLGSVDQVELFGRGRKFVVLGAAFTISGLGLAGFPPFGTYIGKQIMEEAGAAVGQQWITWILLFASIVTGGAVLRAGGMVFLGLGASSGRERGSPTAVKEEPETRKGHRKIPLVMLSCAVVLSVAPLVSVFAANPLTRSINAAARRFADRPAYAREVMKGELTPKPTHEQAVQPTSQGLASGFAAAGGAVALALLSLYDQRLPIQVRRILEKALLPFVTGLRKIHSGHIGDLVVWLVIGMVGIGIGFILATHH
jgi:multicomponent Na+:H+ antiporter subunit D